MTYVYTPLNWIPIALIVIISVVIFYLVMLQIIHIALKWVEKVRRAIRRIKS